ncbi:hypothetical protein QBC44DRAFT_392135 [Cladorrhinum sp. PSN332]|nr:hypothetical protein QBC44DRAFT_392135 [Cladorrhinum sp. PSN332]
MEHSASERLSNCADIVIDLNTDIASLRSAIKGSGGICLLCHNHSYCCCLRYLSGSLCNEYMTPLDHAVIGWTDDTFGSSIRPVRAKARLLWPTTGQEAELEAATSPGPALPPGEALSDTKFLARQQALTQFILMLSDQQLVTGLAILIAGIAKRPFITAYDFNIVFNLAWLSSTTHLATFCALRRHLRTHTLLRNFHVIVVLVQAQATPSDWSDLRQFVFLQIPLIVVALGYFSQIWRLYVDRDISTGLPRRVVVSSQNHTQLTVEQYHKVAAAMDRASVLRQAEPIMHLLHGSPAWQEGVPKPRLFRIARALWSMAVIVLLQEGVFLRCLAAVGFSFAYGITDVVAWRWMPQPELRPDDPLPNHSSTSSMEFGQLLALFLLALPFMSAVEVWNEYKEKQRRNPSDGLIDRSLIPNIRPRAVLPQITKDSEITTVREEFERHQNDTIEYLAGDVYRILDPKDRESFAATKDSSAGLDLGEQIRNTLMRYQRFRVIEAEISQGARTVITGSLGLGIILGMAAGLMFPLDSVDLSPVGIVTLVLIAVHCLLPIVKWYRLRKRFIAKDEQETRVDRAVHIGLARLEEEKSSQGQSY